VGKKNLRSTIGDIGRKLALAWYRGITVRLEVEKEEKEVLAIEKKVRYAQGSKFRRKTTSGRNHFSYRHCVRLGTGKRGEHLLNMDSTSEGVLHQISENLDNKPWVLGVKSSRSHPDDSGS